jgi:hypothetical protein
VHQSTRALLHGRHPQRRRDGHRLRGKNLPQVSELWCVHSAVCPLRGVTSVAVAALAFTGNWSFILYSCRFRSPSSVPGICMVDSDCMAGSSCLHHLCEPPPSATSSPTLTLSVTPSPTASPSETTSVSPSATVQPPTHSASATTSPAPLVDGRQGDLVRLSAGACMVWTVRAQRCCTGARVSQRADHARDCMLQTCVLQVRVVVEG